MSFHAHLSSTAHQVIHVPVASDMQMSTLSPSGNENAVCQITSDSDEHAEQSFEPDLAMHQATVRLNLRHVQWNRGT